MNTRDIAHEWRISTCKRWTVGVWKSSLVRNTFDEKWLKWQKVLSKISIDQIRVNHWSAKEDFREQWRSLTQPTLPTPPASAPSPGSWSSGEGVCTSLSWRSWSATWHSGPSSVSSTDASYANIPSSSMPGRPNNLIFCCSAVYPQSNVSLFIRGAKVY